MKRGAVFCVFLAGCFAELNKGQITTAKGDNGKTLVMLQTRTEQPGFGKLYFKFLGTVGESDNALLELSVASPYSYQFKECHTVELSADGKPLAVEGEPAYEAERTSDGITSEKILIVLSSDSMVSLAQASQLQGKVCQSGFSLSSEQLGKVREFSEMVGFKSGMTKRNVAFTEEDFIPYSVEGTSMVTGQAFLKTRGGDVKYGAAEEVLLFPVTAYSKEQWDRQLVGGRKLDPPDPRFEKYVRRSTGDGEGRFKFDKLPAGEYYVACYITWETGKGKTGGWAGAQIKVAEGEKAETILKSVGE